MQRGWNPRTCLRGDTRRLIVQLTQAFWPSVGRSDRSNVSESRVRHQAQRQRTTNLHHMCQRQANQEPSFVKGQRGEGNALAERVSGVIFSDIKGPIMPADREKNRYLVNFIDYMANHCRKFLVKTKDEATKTFLHFVGHFERRYDCRLPVLRTDADGEHANIDIF
jgi:hypothetical protein